MIVGVMASGKKEPLKDEEKRLAKEVGTAIAELGYHLLTGGGGGSMAAVGAAFLEKKRKLLKANRPAGNLISILRAKELPQKRDGKRTWEANADNGLGEIVIRTHLPFSGNQGNDPLSRNHINALTADLVVILPGGSGTLSELQLAWEYGKDIMIYLGEGNVGGKTPGDLRKDFRDIEIGGNEQQLRSWLKSRKKK
jgi:predicted Rossmann-fold nucleotide-binding protein